MAKFVMLGKYSQEAINSISEGRTKEAIDMIKKAKGKVESIHALLGGYDLILIVDLPNISKAMKVSVDLSKMSGISFTTLPAVTVKEFDKIMQ